VLNFGFSALFPLQQWREKNGIDTILDSPNPNFKAIKASFQHGVVGRTRNGVPVFVEGFGKVKHAMGKLKAQGGCCLRVEAHRERMAWLSAWSKLCFALFFRTWGWKSLNL